MKEENVRDIRGFVAKPLSFGLSIHRIFVIFRVIVRKIFFYSIN